MKHLIELENDDVELICKLMSGSSYLEPGTDLLEKIHNTHTGEGWGRHRYMETGDRLVRRLRLAAEDDMMVEDGDVHLLTDRIGIAEALDVIDEAGLELVRVEEQKGASYAMQYRVILKKK